eukprot:129869-Amphidinium_carterae.1
MAGGYTVKERYRHWAIHIKRGEQNRSLGERTRCFDGRQDYLLLEAWVLKAYEYVRLVDRVTGKVATHRGEATVFPGDLQLTNMNMQIVRRRICYLTQFKNSTAQPNRGINYFLQRSTGRVAGRRQDASLGFEGASTKRE